MNFTFEVNRSERAKQVEILVPAMTNLKVRWALLDRIIPGISKDESDNATIMHFVWVLRDSFYFERELAARTGEWKELCMRWREILNLPEWANDICWWKHPNGEYKTDPNYVVHPCNRTIGWTKYGIVERAKKYGLKGSLEEKVAILIGARQIMNTECDCLIQTPQRLIVIECKDKTDFKSEQEERQKELFKCLERLITREYPLTYIEVWDESIRNRPYLGWSWQEIEIANKRI